MLDIKGNLIQVRSSIIEATQQAGRFGEKITLVAVSKSHSSERILPAINAGQRVFGENKVQEAEGKWLELKAATPEISLHLIGPLQTNKVRLALELFDVIETLDRPKLARRLAKMMDDTGVRPSCFIQVNTGEEPQKAGIFPKDADRFIQECILTLELPILGLMCIPPSNEEASLHFALLREIAKRNGLDNLSMGMSADYGLAIQFGATHVRVGTGVFGARSDSISITPC